MINDLKHPNISTEAQLYKDEHGGVAYIVCDA